MGIGELRKKYPEFLYKGYSYELRKNALEMLFHFEVGEIKFRPKIVIKNVSQQDVKRVGDSALKNLIFHLGLAEMPSYWKATASPKIIVQAGYLNRAQINWWHDLFMKGMGQYFYENKIKFTNKNFLTITSDRAFRGRAGRAGTVPAQAWARTVLAQTLVPIGGGKDAIVTYEILKKALRPASRQGGQAQGKQKIQPFVLNPKKEQLEILNIAGETNPIVVQREIDPTLLALNRKGYLNGHTPFSAYLAFLTASCATLFDYRYIALSNERSSNEGNVSYLGSTINHQYSKSWEFEKKFRAYSKKYLAKNIEYFSFLRPLYELQIAKLFSQYPQYFATFLSCNEAHKTHSGTRKPAEKWCGKCSKCLFAFASLYPFIETKQLEKIFGKNLFDDASLIPLMEELVGKRNFKPFECVGTTRESLAAFYLSLQKTYPPLPALLKHFRAHIAKKHLHLPQESREMLKSWNTTHALPLRLEKELKSVLG